ncbi:MAG TPA: CpXC domain-containing protein, partial [Herpetosiphonaceae bacterium]
MAISFSQPYELVCPACQQPFSHETWVIVDAEERPDLAQAVREVSLHDTSCPHCGQSGVVDAPLLYHDRLARAVLFGAPRGLAEDEWQELAQGLLWALIGALPREAQLPYLGEVQAEAGLGGVAAAVAQLVPRPQSAVEALGDAIGTDEDDEVPALAAAIIALQDARSQAELGRVFELYPFLLDDAIDQGLSDLAEAATDQ